MEKKKAIVKIESFSHKDGKLVLYIHDFGVRAMIKSLVELCAVKYGSYMKLEMSPPYRPRTTGVHGQNRHIWSHIRDISDYTGHDIEDIEDYIKQRAVKRGYPLRQNPFTGEMKPASMKTINTVEAGYLIDELHHLAAEMDIPLEESE